MYFIKLKEVTAPIKDPIWVTTPQRKRATCPPSRLRIDAIQAFMKAVVPDTMTQANTCNKNEIKKHTEFFEKLITSTVYLKFAQIRENKKT